MFIESGNCVSNADFIIGTENSGLCLFPPFQSIRSEELTQTPEAPNIVVLKGSELEVYGFVLQAPING